MCDKLGPTTLMKSLDTNLQNYTKQSIDNLRISSSSLKTKPFNNLLIEKDSVLGERSGILGYKMVDRLDQPKSSPEDNNIMDSHTNLRQNSIYYNNSENLRYKLVSKQLSINEKTSSGSFAQVNQPIGVRTCKNNNNTIEQAFNGYISENSKKIHQKREPENSNKGHADRHRIKNPLSTKKVASAVVSTKNNADNINNMISSHFSS